MRLPPLLLVEARQTKGGPALICLTDFHFVFPIMVRLVMVELEPADGDDNSAPQAHLSL